MAVVTPVRNAAKIVAAGSHSERLSVMRSVNTFFPSGSEAAKCSSDSFMSDLAQSAIDTQFIISVDEERPCTADDIPQPLSGYRH